MKKLRLEIECNVTDEEIKEVEEKYGTLDKAFKSYLNDDVNKEEREFKWKITIEYED